MAVKRVLAAIDGSAGSIKAFDFAVDLARTYGAELLLLAVAHHASAEIDAAVKEYVRVEHVDAPARDPSETAAAALLEQALLDAQAKGVLRIATRVALGDPAHQIIAIASEQEADLIVLGSRGYGRLAGLLVGSVAQKVLGHATGPVLVVR